MDFRMVVFSIILTPALANADCLSKYKRLIDKETNREKIYELDRKFVACQKQEKSPDQYIGNSVSGAKIDSIKGLQNIINEQHLVITSSESSCNNGKCLAIAYITRNEYPRYRHSDNSFCGAFASWQANEKGKRQWVPTNGLASWIDKGNREIALGIIDDKNRTFCR